MTGPKAAMAEPATTATMQIDGKELTLVDIRSTGDILLDVTFKNTTECTKSIPKDALRLVRAQKVAIPSPRILYRVRLETLKKHSEYFQFMLKPQFAEGISVAKTLADLEVVGIDASKVEPGRLPRISIVDEDGATKTFGRELIFRDMLHIIHGSDPFTAPFNTQCLVVLVLMSDRYNVTKTVTRHMQKVLVSHKYPVTQDKSGEEVLRQKIIIQYHTDQGMRFTGSTKELILRGSIRWTDTPESGSEYQAVWWDLPYGLEAELAYRRACVLRAIASIQNQYLQVYSSKERQCKLGYGSSSACDSFQLGEMVKFLTRKGLLSLVPFQASSPYDSDYIWPDAYSGDIEYLIGLLRQCPSYQIDSHHGHCGLRTKLLPALDFVKTCIDTGLGIKLSRSKTGGPLFESWVSPQSSDAKKPVWVGNGDEDVDVTGEKLKLFDYGRGDRSPKGLFTAEKWNWVIEEGQRAVLGGSFMTSVMR